MKKLNADYFKDWNYKNHAKFCTTIYNDLPISMFLEFVKISVLLYRKKSDEIITFYDSSFPMLYCRKLRIIK